MSDRISLVRWRDAKTDPPPTRFAELEPVLMEVDGAVIPGWWNNRDWFDWECSGDSPDMPDRWAYMPSPPGDDALTAARISALLDSLPQRALYDIERVFGGEDVHRGTEVGRTAARLRRAIEEAER